MGFQRLSSPSVAIHTAFILAWKLRRRSGKTGLKKCRVFLGLRHFDSTRRSGSQLETKCSGCSALAHVCRLFAVFACVCGMFAHVSAQSCFVKLAKRNWRCVSGNAACFWQSGVFPQLPQANSVLGGCNPELTQARRPNQV